MYYNLHSFNRNSTLIYDAIDRRGYLAGYTPAQLIARNIVKFYEELGEAAQCVYLDPSERVGPFFDAVTAIARQRFDEKDWTNCGPIDIKKLKKEVADKYVVMSVLVKLIEIVDNAPYDVSQAALDKAEADVRRGVR